MFSDLFPPFGAIARRLNPQQRIYLITGFLLFLLVLMLSLSPDLITDLAPKAQRIQRYLKKAGSESELFLKSRDFNHKTEAAFYVEKAEKLAPADPAVIAAKKAVRALPIGWKGSGPDAEPIYFSETPETPVTTPFATSPEIAIESAQTDPLWSISPANMLYEHADKKDRERAILNEN